MNEFLFDELNQYLNYGEVRYSDRIGSSLDASNIEDALKPFNVDVRTWTNMSKAEILDALDKVKKEVDNDPTKFSGFVFLGMSHGFQPMHKDYLITCDCKLLDLALVVEKFHNCNCIGLKNKPKCYLYNMCRGQSKNIDMKQSNFVQSIRNVVAFAEKTT